MLNKKSIFLTALLLSLSISSFVFSMEIEEGEYRIRCLTRNGGLRSLEAFPGKDIVRPRVDSQDRDQKWEMKSIGNGLYSIRCHTQNGGIRYLEAFPGSDEVRPKAEDPGNVDQKWRITHIDNGYYHISCNTANGGLRCLEAFPKDDVIRPREKSNDQDQRWQFIKWNN